MRTNKERQQLIYRRTRELRCKERRKKQCMFSVCGVALCLMLVIGIGSFMPGVVKQASVGKIIRWERRVCWGIMRHWDIFVWGCWHLRLAYV